jgi:hypothetical protein
MKQMSRFLLSLGFAVAIVFCIPVGTGPMAAQTVFRPDIPKTWDENACRRLQASRHDLRSSFSIAVARDKKALEDLKVEPRPDGTLMDVLWVPTSQGVALSAPSCGSCHTYYSRTGRSVSGSAVRRWTDVPCEPSEDRNRPDRLRADHF